MRETGLGRGISNAAATKASAKGHGKLWSWVTPWSCPQLTPEEREQTFLPALQSIIGGGPARQLPQGKGSAQKGVQMRAVSSHTPGSWRDNNTSALKGALGSLPQHPPTPCRICGVVGWSRWMRYGRYQKRAKD